MSLIVKFKLGNEVRSLGSLNQSNATYDAIRQAVMRVFKLKGLSLVDKYSLQYADDEGDLIRISNNGDLQEAYALYLDAGKPELMIHLASANAADFGFELVDDDTGITNKSSNVSSRNAVDWEAQPVHTVAPVVQREIVVEQKEVVVYRDHPLLNVLLAEFVEHVTYPDRTIVGANSRLRKTWRVKNIGACSWPEGCILMYQSGDKVFEAREFITSAVHEGEEVDLSIDVTTPARAGRYTTFYRLANPSGKQAFGPHLWIDVIVQGAAAIPAEDDSKRVEHPKPLPIETPAAPLECPQTFGKYNAGMLQLWNMGYKDTGRNLYLLDKYNGDTQNVVLFLIEHNY
eukprot:TRINITY_DN13490_c0_g2_i1.p3 TRINITY_DN13490_c0_g2~~TRINITY_DN13490_c0_g2_i1.p3  ORF type:complete len:344 (+),score=91.29 TRINITY_DN13490_c0_g2_i1:1427-2458(+)